MMGEHPRSRNQRRRPPTAPGDGPPGNGSGDLFLQYAPAALAMFDADMRLVLATRRWLAEFGVPPEGAAGRSFYELVPDAPPSWRQAHRRCLGGSSQRVERERFQRADGSTLLLRWEVTPWFAPGGGVGGLIMVAEPLGPESQARSLLAVATRMFRSLYNQMPVMLFSIDRQGLISDVNQFWLDRLGYAASEVLGRPLVDFLSVHSRKYAERVLLPAFLETGVLDDEPLQFVKKDGSPVEMVVSATANRDSAGHVVDSVAVATDITDLREAEEKLRQTAAALQVVNEAVVIADQSGRITAVNPAFTELTGYTEADVAGNPLFALFDRGQGDRLAQVEGLLEERDHWSGKLELLRKGARPLAARVTIDRMRAENGRLSHQVMRCEPPTAPVQPETDENADLDPVTHLPNRHLLEARLTDAILRASSSDTELAVCYVDLDRFKTVNESLGHEVGDRILRATARRLTGLVRAEDLVSRIGGDDFVVVLRSIRDRDDVARFGDKLLEALSNPLRLGAYEVCLTASVGISMFPEDGTGADALLRNADAAMHRAKEGGGNHVHFYTSELTTDAHKRLNLDTALRRALKREEFELHYQPQVTGAERRVLGVEALLRWRHPKSGLLRPVSFLEYAEETGLIVGIGEWVLHTACRQVREWEHSGLHELRTAINVSARQLVEDRFVDSVREAVEAAGISPDHLELEVTESIFLKHSEKLLHKLRELKEFGITLTIDDFGAGYSSLGYLKHLPVDRLKIDRGFVKDLPSDPRDAAIARAIVSLSENLALDVVAEGVETEDQFICLYRMGCRHTQGYLFGRPMAPQALFRLIAGAGGEA